MAGLERLSQAFRVLLWEKAGEQRLSPIQTQLLLFIHYHRPDKNNVSYLAREFNLTKPTISDAVKTLEKKELVIKVADLSDSRRYHLELTEKGREVVAGTEQYAAPFAAWIAGIGQENKEQLWQAVSGLIRALSQSSIISVQRCCFSCRYYRVKESASFCNLLNETLLAKDIRLDCPDHQYN